MFIAQNLYPIESSESIQEKIDKTLDDLNKSAPPGSWMMNSGNPFLPQHRLRANLQMKRLMAEKSIRDAYYQAMFGQFEKARLVTSISPVSAFRFLAEAVVGGGYERFRKTWGDFHVYQAQFLIFFGSLDAQDPKSPHWFNPNENISTTKKPVAFATVPQFMEKPLSFVERILPVLKYVMLSLFSSIVVLFLSYVLFVKYDAR